MLTFPRGGSTLCNFPMSLGELLGSICFGLLEVRCDNSHRSRGGYLRVEDVVIGMDIYHFFRHVGTVS